MDGLILLLVCGGWIFCGAISWAIAHDKGNDGCLGFALGVVFGPLGILIAAVLPSNSRFVQNQQRAALEEQRRRGYLKRCPFCLGYIPPAAIACQHCGRDLPSQQADPPQLLVNGCTSCGATNPPEYKFCGACGAPLQVANLTAR